MAGTPQLLVSWKSRHLPLSLSPDPAPPVTSEIDSVGCSFSLMLRKGRRVSDDALTSPVRVCDQGVDPEAVGPPGGPGSLMASLLPQAHLLSALPSSCYEP